MTKKICVLILSLFGLIIRLNAQCNTDSPNSLEVNNTTIEANVVTDVNGRYDGFNPFAGDCDDGQQFFSYNNHVTGNTTIKLDNAGSESYTLTVYDIFGQPVQKTTNIKSAEIEIAQNLVSGFYFIRLSSDKQSSVKTGKLFIK